MTGAYAAFLAAVRTAAGEHDKTLGHVDGPDAWALADSKFYAAVMEALDVLRAADRYAELGRWLDSRKPPAPAREPS